jgi:hypothetical protein
MEERKKNLEKKKIEEITLKESDCTYHPSINEISSIIAVTTISFALVYF